MAMADRLSSALYEVKRSAIREFGRMAKETPGCLSLTLGEPDFNTPLAVRDAAKEALDLGETHYIENNGVASLRQAIAAFERDHNGMDYAADEVIVTVGATEGLFTALFGMLNPSDEVIVPTPAFGLYESIITLCRGVYVPLDTRADHFQLTPEALASVVTERTKAIILTSPNNPTGCIYTEASLEAVHALARERELFVICDDVYRQLVYTDSYRSFADFRDLREQIIVIQSFSKPYAMTGWRVGYLLADRSVKTHLEKAHQFTVVSAASTAQRACEAALQEDPTPMVETYRRRRDFVLKRLSQIGLPVNTPEGAFYVFPSIEAFGLDSATFCTRMIREGGLAATPGFCFGAEGYIRLSYCASDAVLTEAMDRLERFVAKLRREQEAL